MAAFDEEEYKKSLDWKIWKRLLPFLGKYRMTFVGMVAFNGVCGLIDVALPLFQRYAIANFIEKQTLHGLLPFALVYGAVIVVQAISVVPGPTAFTSMPPAGLMEIVATLLSELVQCTTAPAGSVDSA